MSRKLNFEYIAQKTKCENPASIRNLNVWGCELEDISVLREMPNLECVSLSVNHINTLKDFSGLSNLRELYLRKNRISDIQEIRYLKGLKNLKTLWLSENPIDRNKNYRSFVIKNIPQLLKLDDTNITDEERRKANLSENDIKSTIDKNSDLEYDPNVGAFAKENNIDVGKYFPEARQQDKMKKNKLNSNNNLRGSDEKLRGEKQREVNSTLPVIGNTNYNQDNYSGEYVRQNEVASLSNINQFNYNNNGLKNMPNYSQPNFNDGIQNQNYNYNRQFPSSSNVGSYGNYNQLPITSGSNTNYYQKPSSQQQHAFSNAQFSTDDSESSLNSNIPSSAKSSTIFNCVSMLINELGESDLETIKLEISKKLSYINLNNNNNIY